jgi:signal transduction histidine kinase
MVRTVSHHAGVVLLGLLCAGLSHAASPLAWLSPELREIEAERQALSVALGALPSAPAPQLTQRLGWHSDYTSSPDTIEWVELSLGHPTTLDSVVLIAPAPSGGAAEPGYGFPLRFRVELLGEGDETQRTVLADYTREDFPNPGLLPVVIPAQGRTAHKVRITATRLFREDQRYLAALGEVMLLQGQRNLGVELEAIGPSAVHASSSQGTRPDWGRINLVDGHSVLGPPVGGRPSPTLGFRSLPESEIRSKSLPWVEIDLGHRVAVDEVRLFPSHPPQFAHSHGYGFPVRYQVELRENVDAPPVVLSEPQSGGYSAPPGDNVVIIAGSSHPARHVRLTVLEPHVSNGSVVLALAEMQVWSGGKNVAQGKDVMASSATEAGGWSKPALVDGFASSAEIVDWPAWLAGLSKRRETLHKMAALDRRQTALEQGIQRLGWWALGALVLMALAALTTAYLRQRQARRLELEALRQRISQDLHDEIGSSLGSIVLITDDALSLAHDEELRQELGEIRDTARQTLDSMRDIVRLAQTGTYGRGDLTAHLREIADRMLRGMGHTLNAGPADAASTLPMDQQRDLVLMFKETLHNLTRHAQASHVDITLAKLPRQLTLTIQDNGCGFVPAQAAGQGMGLTNLQRRAAKHGGSVDITSAPGKGTTIRITLPNHG